MALLFASEIRTLFDSTLLLSRSIIAFCVVISLFISMAICFKLLTHDETYKLNFNGKILCKLYTLALYLYNAICTEKISTFLVFKYFLEVFQYYWNALKLMAVKFYAVDSPIHRYGLSVNRHTFFIRYIGQSPEKILLLLYDYCGILAMKSCG